VSDRIAITPDGQEHHFPEGTPDAVIDAAIKKYLGSAKGEDRSQWSPIQSINNVINQIGTGVYRGVAGFAALPRTISDLAADRSKAPRRPVAGRALPGAEQYVQTQIQPGSRNPGQYLPSADDLIGMLESGTQKAADFTGIQGLAFKAAQPETTADKYLQAGGAGASGVFLPGGALPNFVGGVSGGIGSEAAGQLTEGTPLEPYARIAGAIIPAVFGSYLTNRAAASNVEQLLNRATTDYTPDEWAAAIRLQSDAAARGTPITAAEALAQVKGGNRTLMSVQRTVEQMPETERTMSQFMAGRPGANQAALAGQLDDIAPRQIAPTEIGPRIQQGAQDYVSGIRQDINRQTEPLYWASQFDRVPQSQFAQISQNPAFQIALERVRADRLLGPPLAAMPDDSIAVINAVKKEMDEMGAAFNAYGTEGYSPTRAGAVETGRAPLVETASRASPMYGEALEIQAARRGAELAPAERAPIGQLALTDDAAQQAKILLPKESLKASPEQIGGTVRELVNQGRADDVASLLRTIIQDTYAKSASNVKGMGEQLRGAQLANNLLKNPNQYESLEAAIRQLPNGETTWTGFRRLLDVFEAQGQRLLPGSPTSFNQQLAENFGRNLGQGVKSFGTQMWANWNVQRRSQELARILTDPEGVALLRQLAVIGPNTARAQQLVQGFYQGGQAGNRLLEDAR
jgi:hypothetical protein